MKSHLIYALTLPLLFWLSGCAQQQTVNNDNANSTNKPYEKEPIAQINAKSELNCWKVEGKIGVKPLAQPPLSTLPSSAPLPKGGSANLQWNQNGDHYFVQLNGPLGQGKVIIEGSPSGVTLTDKHGTVNSDRAETLLERAIGWSIPVDHLRWWIRGLPAPVDGIPIDKNNYVLDSSGHIQSLLQSDWTIEYPRLQPVETPLATLILPRKIRATHPRLKTTLSLNRWRFSGCEHAPSEQPPYPNHTPQ